MATNIDPIYAVIGTAIRDQHNQTGLTQEELDVKVGLTRTSINNIEAGSRSSSIQLLTQLPRRLPPPWEFPDRQEENPSMKVRRSSRGSL